MSAVLGPLLLLTLCVAASVAQERFGSALDDVDIDKILASRRLVENYVACLTSKKTCPPQIAEVKRALPEIIKSTCSKCSKSQIIKISEGITKLKKLYPAEFRKLSEVWDPKGENFNKFQAKAKGLQG